MFNFWLACSFFFGSMIGSFLNCLVWRLYHDESLWTRSHCPHCQHQIAWYDNLPIFSFLFLRARCRHCQASIHWQYLATELALACLFAFSFWYHFQGLSDLSLLAELTSWNFTSLSLLRDWLIIAFFSAIFIMDYQWYVVADEISLPGIISVFIFSLALSLVWPSLTPALVWWKLLLAGIVGGGFFSLQYYLSGGRWVGAGDIRIGALMGVALGWPVVLVGLALAYFIGALAAVYLIIIRKKQSFDFKHLWQPSEPTEAAIIPFGPFLAVGALIALFYGPSLLTWYLNFMYY